jgi:glycosyltransferase involved in cell wall biosynthesis
MIKGLDLALQALSRLLDRLNSVKLVIAGPDDGYLSTLTALLRSLQLEEHVILTGNLDDQAKWSALEASDVLALPSLYDAFPLAVLEAWSMGLPAIVAPRTGLADWAHRGAGIVVPRDQDVWADALFELLTDPGKRRTLGETGKKLIEHHFTWERVVDRLERAYYDVLEEAGEG